MHTILRSLLVLSLIGTANAQPAPPPKPVKPPDDQPSSGKELAKPPPAVAKLAEFARQMAQTGKCEGVAHRLSAALSIATTELTDAEKLAGNLALRKCAYTDKSWKSYLKASNYLLAKAPDKADPNSIVYALLNLGEEKSAEEAIKELAKKFPAKKAHLTASFATMKCRKSDHKLCFKATTQTLAFLAKEGGAPPNVLAKNHFLHARAALALGLWPDFDASIAALGTTVASAKLDPKPFERLKSLAESVKRSKLYLEIDPMKELTLGMYHLANQTDANALMTLRMVNHGKAARSLKASVEVPGLTEPITFSMVLQPGAPYEKRVSPPLKLDFDVAKLRAARDGQIAFKLVDIKSNATVYEQSYPTSILPRDHLPLRRLIGNDHATDTFNNSAAWITPNAPEIDAFLKKAKARMPKRTFTGTQSETLPQVQALFEELRAMGVSYVMDPDAFAENVFVQRTRLPAEVLATTNAQCLEGTLLYATLFEAIGLEPVLVFVPGHAFVAWKTSKYDKGLPSIMFLETTMTGGDKPFLKAVTRGFDQFQEHSKANNFKYGAAALVDVAPLRKKGFRPQPY